MKRQRYEIKVYFCQKINKIVMVDIKITPIEESRISQVDFTSLVFGKEFSDYMFVCAYREGALAATRD